MTTIPDLLKKRAQLSPAAPAFYYSGSNNQWRSFSWSEYLEKTLILSAYLRNKGVKKGDYVFIAIHSSHKWELLHMAFLHLGAIIVGLDSQISTQQLVSMYKQLPCACFVGNSEEQISILQTIENNIPLLINTEDSKFSQLCLDARQNYRNDLQSFPELSPQDQATVIFTSGTTGAPKGIPFNHAQIISAIEAICETLPIDNSDIIPCWLPLSSLFQRMINFSAIKTGATIYFITNPNTIIEKLSEIKPTIFFGVPRIYEKLYAISNAHIKSTSKWRGFLSSLKIKLLFFLRQSSSYFAILKPICNKLEQKYFAHVHNLLGNRIKFMLTGSAPISKTIVEFFYACGLPLLQGYALSENTTPIALGNIKKIKVGSVGHILSNNQIFIDPQGEILVKGPGLFKGYLDSSNDVFTSDGFYRTGDFGYLDNDEYLYLTGRQSELIKTSTGKFLPLVQIESAYKRIPYVEQIIVFGQNLKCPVAIISPLSGAGNKTDSSAIIKDLKVEDFVAAGNHLPHHQRVKAVAILRNSFSIETGELTNTQKLRRQFIEKKYKQTIDNMVNRLDGCESSNKADELAILIIP